MRELTHEEKIAAAKTALHLIVARWRKESDEAKSDHLWGCVIEADRRLAMCKGELANAHNCVCPACGKTQLFVFLDEDHNDEVRGCKSCGWTNKDVLRKTILQAAREISKAHR